MVFTDVGVARGKNPGMLWDLPMSGLALKNEMNKQNASIMLLLHNEAI